ncbi:hypothetical protein GQ42DRAFT_91703 [Ramicandelaber brevisporus]|nr:hypothetical protein GQ42DRAFT_91703 [Ramicandelaber brevisporus]
MRNLHGFVYPASNNFRQRNVKERRRRGRRRRRRNRVAGWKSVCGAQNTSRMDLRHSGTQALMHSDTQTLRNTTFRSRSSSGSGAEVVEDYANIAWSGSCDNVGRTHATLPPQNHAVALVQKASMMRRTTFPAQSACLHISHPTDSHRIASQSPSASAPAPASLSTLSTLSTL